ncbi:MAG: DUF6732 family protein [Pseudomonadota bacterium]
MRIFIFFLLLGSPALAHPGHLAEVAGHGHWLGAAAIGAAIAIGLYAGLRGRKAKAEETADDEATAEDAEPQES